MFLEMKSQVIMLLKTLNYRDFVNVVLYMEYPTFYSANMVQANQNNINYIIEFIENININVLMNTDFGLSLDKTLEMLLKSIEDDDDIEYRRLIPYMYS